MADQSAIRANVILIKEKMFVNLDSSR